MLCAALQRRDGKPLGWCCVDLVLDFFFLVAFFFFLIDVWKMVLFHLCTFGVFS